MYLRKRLFKLLDEARNYPVIWITAPPGAGKTTLISTYLEQKKLPCLWYQVDEGDGDIASFFHYMGIAAKQANPRKKKPLPNLTPEYLLGLPTFTRNYFRELYNRVSKSQSIKVSKRSDTLTHGHSDTKNRFIIVLDNYQDVPANSPLHEIIQTGLSEMTEGINVIIISRVQPPDAIARIQASNNFTMLKWDDLKLTEDESIGIARLRSGKKKLSQETLNVIHEETQGWVAGLVLMLEQYKETVIPKEISNQGTHEAVFNYFAGEIFQRTDKDTQEFLLKTAFLTKATAPMARQLTGMEAEDIFSGLIKKNYFTIKHFLPEPAYEYHPLFRAFLEDKANKTFASEKLIQLKKDAARLLSENNEIEAAILLLWQINEWGLLIPLILKHAKGLVGQGRSQTLEVWLRAIPEELHKEQSWLLYWLGVCRMPFNLPEGRGYFEQAFEKFKIQNDAAGIFLAWAGVVETYIYQWGDFKPLDKWIAEIETLLVKYPAMPSPEIEAKVTAGVFTALMYRQPQHPDLPIWTERLHRLIEVSPDASSSMIMGNHLLLYYTWWSGDLAKGTNLVNMLEPLSHIPDLAPLTRIAWHAIKSAHCWITADNAGCIQAVEEGLKIAEATGVHVWDFILLAQGVWGVLTSREIDKVPSMFKQMLSVMDKRRLLDVCHYRYQAYTEAMQCNDVRQMLEHAEAALRLAKEAGVIWVEGIMLPAVARAYIVSGRHDEAAEIIKQAMQIAQDIRSKTIESAALHVEAELAMEKGNESACLHALQKTFTFDRKQGFVNNTWGRFSVMSRLCAIALEHNIEADYVISIIRRCGFIPPEDAHNLDNWPWPVRVYTLGRFEILKEDKPIQFAGKTPKKPLELLKSIIAFGGRNVSQNQLIEVLWPDADGAAAQSALDTTLYRLRKLIGNEPAITSEGGVLSINSRICWLDTWAFEHLIKQADITPASAEKVISLYNGPFLNNDLDIPWTLSLREYLHYMFVQHIIAISQRYEAEGDIYKAIACYEKGLYIDSLAEEIYQHLMRCYDKIGQKANAISVYNRCRKALSANMGMAPSPATKEIYEEIQKG